MASEVSTSSKTAPKGTGHVLIVEDDMIISSTLRLLFERRGWQVTVASTIRQARTRLEPEPDWIILDLMLPDGEGAELLRTIRERQLSIRVAVTTGATDKSRVQAILELEPDAFLRKPVSFNQLLCAMDVDPEA